MSKNPGEDPTHAAHDTPSQTPPGRNGANGNGSVATQTRPLTPSDEKPPVAVATIKFAGPVFPAQPSQAGQTQAPPHVTRQAGPAGPLPGTTPRAAHSGGVEPLRATRATLIGDRLVTGGDGNVTSFKDNGGRLLTNARIVLMFWGTAWANSATTPSTTNFTDAIAGIIGGPWGTQLGQYRGIGPLVLEQVDVASGSDPAVSFTDPQISDFINGRIDGGFVPTPSDAIDRIYVVAMPTGHTSGDTSFVGQHQFEDRNGSRIYWAWLTNDGTLTGGNSIPKIFCHEVAETCSNPDLGSGIVVNGSDEIGDVCNNTVQTVNGVAEEAYWSQADSRCVIPQFAALPAVAGVPALIQSRFGTRGNFELVMPLAAGGLAHVWRNNDNPFMPLSSATPFGASAGACGAVSMIESNYGSPGNLELVAVAGNSLLFYWRDSGPAFNWNGPYLIETGVSGNPALIQSRFGAQGNFELVVPLATGGLAHYWRNNDDPAMPWIGPFPFGAGLGPVDAVTLIESNYGSPGNLEAIARVGANLYHFWRDSGPAFAWNGPFEIEAGAAGNPVLIQSRFGAQGNFELVTPLQGGGLAHYWRNNDDPALPWNGPFPFGANLGPVDAVTLIESNYGSPGNLEVVARTGSVLQFFWRDSGPAFNWNGPYLLQSTIW